MAEENQVEKITARETTYSLVPNAFDYSIWCDKIKHILNTTTLTEDKAIELVSEEIINSNPSEGICLTPEEKPTNLFSIKIFDNLSSILTLKELERREFNYRDIPRKSEVVVTIGSPFLDLIEDNSISWLNYEHKFRIYLAQRGVGLKNFFVLVPYKTNLSMGESSLCLRPVSGEYFSKLVMTHLQYPELEKLIKLIDKRYKIDRDVNRVYIPMRDDPFDIGPLSEVLASFETMVPMSPIDDRYTKLCIKKFGFGKILDDFLDENYTHDPEFKYFARSALLNYGNETIPQYMRYQPHGLMQTNTKIGKSQVFKKICGNLKFDRASAANLLGFSGGKKNEIKEGTLNKRYESSCWDDLEKNFGEGLVDELPSLLELGETVIAKGICTLTTRYSGATLITTNTKGENQDMETMAIQLMDIVNKICINPERAGSRFGYIIFTDNWKQGTLKDYALTEEDIQINERITKSIFEKISGMMPDLIRQLSISQFLETKDKDFASQITSRVSSARLAKNTKDFLISFIEGYRHQKGLALKEGVISYFIENDDELINLLEGRPINTEELLEVCKAEWNVIKNMQLTMINKFITTECNKRFSIDNLPKYLRAILLGVSRYLKEQKPEKNQLIVLEQLNPYLEKQDTYSDIGSIADKIPKNLDRLNRMTFNLDIVFRNKSNEITIQVNKTTVEIFNTEDLENRLLASLTLPVSN